MLWYYGLFCNDALNSHQKSLKVADTVPGGDYNGYRGANRIAIPKGEKVDT